MVISPEDFARFQSFLNEKTGILLGDNKQYLVASRLSSVLKEKQLSSLSELLTQIRSPMNSALLQTVIDKMTTNETLWFRDGFPFDYLNRSILPEIKQAGKSRASIWCAACSTGQEPYSIAMGVEEAQSSERRAEVPMSVDIVSTDISTRVLEQARLGEYQSIEITRGLSLERQKRFFTQSDAGAFVLQDQIRRKVRFSTLNLLQTPYKAMGKFDVIFCRNVLIYFSAELKEKVILGLSECLNDGGYLFLGASESMPASINQFEMVRCNPGLVYKKK